MKARLCAIAVLLGCLLVCGIPALAQNLTVNGNVNLQSCDTPPCPVKYAYQIDGLNVLRIAPTRQDGSNLYLGRNAGEKNDNWNLPSTFLGNFAGNNTTAGDGNTFVGYASGSNNLMGQANTYVGYKAAGYYQTSTPPGPSGSQNTFVGFQAGTYNTRGSQNTFLGHWAGYSNTLGNRNVFVGLYSGFYNKTGSNNIYLSNQGPTQDESGTIRIGQSPNQTAAYIAGIYDASTNYGRAVFVDSDGKLGTKTMQESSQEDLIKAQQQQIADLQERVARLEAIIAKK
jgi:hypothetical protein